MVKVDEEQFGTTITRELRSGGAKIQVTDENKEEYIQEVINWRFVNRVKDQVRKDQVHFTRFPEYP